MLARPFRLLESYQEFLSHIQTKNLYLWSAHKFPVQNNCCSAMLSLLCKRVCLVTGPGNWNGTCKTGTKQSPIAIKSADTEYAENLGSFTLKNYNLTPSNVKFTATNNGNISTIVFKFSPNIYNVSGGGLGDVYTTVQFHLHWGSDNNNGSEHTLNGKEFAAEVSEWKTYWKPVRTVYSKTVSKASRNMEREGSEMESRLPTTTP